MSWKYDKHTVMHSVLGERKIARHSDYTFCNRQVLGFECVIASFVITVKQPLKQDKTLGSEMGFWHITHTSTQVLISDISISLQVHGGRNSSVGSA